MALLKEKEEKLLRMTCSAFMRPGNSTLLERLKRNEEANKNMFMYCTEKWKAKATSSLDEQIRRRVRWRKKTNQKGVLLNYRRISDNAKTQKIRGIEAFKAIAYRVCLLRRVFRKMREYAIERGGHVKVCSGAMQLKDSVVGSGEQKDLLFNADDFKNQYQFAVPKWCRKTCALPPEQRTVTEVQNMANLMRQLKDFRKYSRKMLLLLARIVRYERFGRRRVIVRKNHIGMSFYVIFSGLVGVVIDDDEDKAFENEEKPANVLKKGDSFGEVALVQRSVRTATVVCFQTTEFLVIDKDEFYALGVEKCAQEEMIFRYNFMSSLDIFKSWKENILKQVAAGARNIEFLCDRVVDRNSTASEYIYIISKGQCDVLRLLDLTVLDDWNINSPRLETLSTTTGYSGSTACSFRSGSKLSKTSLPVYNNSMKQKLNETTSQSSLNSSAKVHFNNNRSSCTSPTASMKSSNTTLNKHSEHHPSSSTPNRRDRSRTTSTRVSQDGRRTSWEAVRDMCCTTNLGLGAFLKIDILAQGQIFGLNYLLHEDEQGEDCKRKFILLSSGCEVIRIPKSVLRTNADDFTINKIKNMMRSYPTDEELYEIFKRQNRWRYFREQLVDNIVEFGSGVKKAFKERCTSIPKLPKINNIQYLSRNVSPVNDWKRLADDGYIKQSSRPPSIWSVSPCPPIDEETSQSNQTPFVQKKIITSNGSQRMLVLTHGGSRVNKFRLDTKAHSTCGKNTNYA